MSDTRENGLRRLALRCIGLEIETRTKHALYQTVQRVTRQRQLNVRTLLTQYMSRTKEAIPELAAWTRTGKLRVDEHIEEGIENALPAFLRLFDGSNDGKMILKLA
jgi:NADPH-dependent curcumin reductase CurA